MWQKKKTKFDLKMRYFTFYLTWSFDLMEQMFSVDHLVYAELNYSAKYLIDRELMTKCSVGKKKNRKFE